jgi:hypothetical protein
MLVWLAEDGADVTEEVVAAARAWLEAAAPP